MALATRLEGGSIGRIASASSSGIGSSSRLLVKAAAPLILTPPPSSRTRYSTTTITTTSTWRHGARSSPSIGRYSPPSALPLRRSFWTSSPWGKDASTSDADSGSGSSSGTNSNPSFAQRMRFLFKRYGWWAFAVYNLWSLADFSITWAIIHWAGADYIREIETSVREKIGMGQREHTDVQVAQWPLHDQNPAVVQGTSTEHENNESAASKAAQTLQNGTTTESNTKNNSSSGSLWAEAVLAYTIHKTLLLPFRVMGTGAVTPSFVKHMVKLGWAKPLPPLAGAATAATVSAGSKATASKGLQEAGKKGISQAVKQ
ncbi:unnamed protein product [Sympodiomycopsis kandeliae]